MRADVAKGERLAPGIAPEHQRNLETRRSHEPSPTDDVAAQNRIPKTPEKFVAALRGARDRQWCGLLHHILNLMIAAAMIYGPPGLPNRAVCAPFIVGGFLVPRGYGILSGHA